MSLLEVKNLNSGYGDLQILRNINLKVEESEIVALLGSNGAGKSTLMRTIVGLNRAWSGEVIVNGKNITNGSSDKIVKAGISIVPEGRRLFAGMTVSENLEMGAFCNRKNIKERMDKIFQIFPRLFERKDHLAGDLSGGEQQMLAIARALMARPRVMLLDEPSMGLAPILVQEIFAIIQEINQQGTTILLVEQNANMALRIARRGYVLETGRVALQGPSHELRENPQVKAVYLGETRSGQAH